MSLQSWSSTSEWRISIIILCDVLFALSTCILYLNCFWYPYKYQFDFEEPLYMFIYLHYDDELTFWLVYHQGSVLHILHDCVKCVILCCFPWKSIFLRMNWILHSYVKLAPRHYCTPTDLRQLLVMSHWLVIKLLVFNWAS